MRNIIERNILAEKYLGLAKTLAERRYKTVHRTVQYDELLSAAYQGLLTAAQKFDVEKVNAKATRPFECYATPRIKGEMNDYLRSCNWGTRTNPCNVTSLEHEYATIDSESGFLPTLRDTIPSMDRSVVDELNGQELFFKLIRSLPKREKDVFRLRYIEGFTMQEVASVLDISESRVSQILSQNAKYLYSIWSGKAEELWNEIKLEI